MSTKTDVKNEEGTGWVAPLCHVGLDEMIHAMMNEFFSPSSFWRRMVALVLPPLAAKKIETKTASRRKREQDCKREGGREEGGRGYSRLHKKGAAAAPPLLPSLYWRE